jgi:hypothetical protein
MAPTVQPIMLEYFAVAPPVQSIILKYFANGANRTANNNKIFANGANRTVNNIEIFANGANRTVSNMKTCFSYSSQFPFSAIAIGRHVDYSQYTSIIIVSIIHRKLRT